MMEDSARKGFMTDSTNEIYEVMDNAEDILDYLDSYSPEIGRVFKF
jgi:hypothetical protein